MKKNKYLICYTFEGTIKDVSDLTSDLSKYDNYIPSIRIEQEDDTQGMSGEYDLVFAGEAGATDKYIQNISEIQSEEKSSVPVAIYDRPDLDKFRDKQEEFEVDDFVYGYDAGMDRWLPYTIVSIKDNGVYSLQNYQVGAPYQSGDIIEYDADEVDTELRKQPEDKVFLVQDYLYASGGRMFEDYVKEQSELVKDVYVDRMSGTVDIYWNDPTMNGFTTQATPFWEEPEEIPVQVSIKDGDPIDNNINDTNVLFGATPEFFIGNNIYPNEPTDFYQAYVDVLPEILNISKLIVEEYEQGLDYAKGGTIIHSSDKYGSDYWIDNDGDLFYRPMGSNEEWSLVSEEAFSESERKEFDKEMKKLFGKKINFKKGGEINITDLKKGDFVYRKGSNIAVKVISVEKDKYSDDDVVELYDDLTGRTHRLINLSGYEMYSDDDLSDASFSKGGRVMSIERLAQKLERAYPDIRMRENEDSISVFEDFPTDRRGDSIADYYSESQDRVFGMANHFDNFLKRNGYWAEWVNPEHFKIYKLDSYEDGGEISTDNKALITGGLAGILLGIFLNK